MQLQHLKQWQPTMSNSLEFGFLFYNSRIPSRHQIYYRNSCLSWPGKRMFTSHVPAVLVPPLIFLSLGVGLWTWKCCMMVLFQNKIIYMPGLPPNARRERIASYAKQTLGVAWREVRIKSSDSTEIALCVAATKSQIRPASPVYILYFQGMIASGEHSAISN